MKKTLILFISIISFGVTFSQNYDVRVENHSGKVGKINHAGVAIHIDLDKKDIKDYWKKELKKMGKIESEGGVYLIESARMSAVSSQPVRVLSKVETTPKGTQVWLSVNNGSDYVKNGSSGYNGVKNLLQDFAKSMYKLDIERQISDAEKAVETSKKDQTKVLTQGEELAKDLQVNEEKKVELESNIEQNNVDQELAVKNVEEMEQALELVKAKLEKVK